MLLIRSASFIVLARGWCPVAVDNQDAESVASIFIKAPEGLAVCADGATDLTVTLDSVSPAEVQVDWEDDPSISSGLTNTTSIVATQCLIPRWLQRPLIRPTVCRPRTAFVKSILLCQCVAVSSTHWCPCCQGYCMWRNFHHHRCQFLQCGHLQLDLVGGLYGHRQEYLCDNRSTGNQFCLQCGDEPRRV